ncbi:MAG: asparagine synthase C-terminal domain-containing protein, partial [Patescibacteria group bacterium]|nr:asparagine synthase C-terminal domain-containing protein [Patescibacteria group bacterium]
EEMLPPRPAARRAAPRSLADAETTVARLFRESVRATLQADVPVGIFLSGGIDSTLIAQEAHALGARLQAFTIGFADADFDESQVAAAAAARLGFPHTTRLLPPEDMADDLPAIFDAFGEPFADTSMLPTYYLAQTAREAGYKVALAGDGADELFGGYPTHYLPRITRYWRQLPQGADALLAQLAARLPERQTALGAKEKLARFLAGARLPYQEAHGVWKRVFTDADLAELLSADLPQAANPARAFDDLDALDPVEATMAVDFRTFLAADCLVKSDICAMRHGVEVRAPFLNRAIVDFARSLPPAWKARPLRTKILLRRVLARTLGAQARLPKRGFVPPLGRWLAGPLREPMRALLAEAAIAKVGFIEYTYVKRLMDEHERGGRDHTKKLWSLMSLSRFYGRL